MARAETVAYVPVLLIFRDQVEFNSEMTAGSSRVRAYGNSATRGIHRIVFRRQPEIVKHPGERPPLSNLFVNAGADVLDVPPAELIGKVHLVVSGGINLVVSAPGVSVWVLRARSVIVLHEQPGCVRALTNVYPAFQCPAQASME